MSITLCVFSQNKYLFAKLSRTVEVTMLTVTETLTLFEPRHEKTNIMGLRPAWIQTSLRINAVRYQILYLL
jgi:hypothetical protein